MEDKDSVLTHMPSNSLKVMNELSFKLLWALYVDGILDMSCLIFIIESGIYDHVWMVLTSNKICQSLTTDCVYVWMMLFIVAKLLEQHSFTILLIQIFINTWSILAVKLLSWIESEFCEFFFG